MEILKRGLLLLKERERGRNGFRGGLSRLSEFVQETQQNIGVI